MDINSTRYRLIKQTRYLQTKDDRGRSAGEIKITHTTKADCKVDRRVWAAVVTLEYKSNNRIKLKAQYPFRSSLQEELRNIEQILSLMNSHLKLLDVATDRMATWILSVYKFLVGVSHDCSLKMKQACSTKIPQFKHRTNFLFHTQESHFQIALGAKIVISAINRERHINRQEFWGSKIPTN